MALRRRRTRNPKYFSEEFESVFTEKKNLLSEGYMEVVVEDTAPMDEGETVVIDDYDGQQVQYTQVSVCMCYYQRDTWR